MAAGDLLKAIIILIDVFALFGALAFGVAVSTHLAPYSVYTVNTEYYISMFLLCIGVLIVSPIIWKRISKLHDSD
ncbi:MAG: hypothetical protein ACFFBL_13725 [Promethearchaeota archaeon]